MPKNKDLAEITDYNYEVMKQAIIDGKDEILFMYNNISYSLGIAPSENKSIIKNISDTRKGLKTKRQFANETKKEVLLIDYPEIIFEKIRIDGKELKEIWDEIILL